jgi:hypothetical protein
MKSLKYSHIVCVFAFGVCVCLPLVYVCVFAFGVYVCLPLVCVCVCLFVSDM